jgi:hypothetical protein
MVSRQPSSCEDESREGEENQHEKHERIRFCGDWIV